MTMFNTQFCTNVDNGVNFFTGEMCHVPKHVAHVQDQKMIRLAKQFLLMRINVITNMGGEYALILECVHL